MSNFFNNFFGSIANSIIPFPTNKNFIPLGVNGNATTGQDVLWIKGGEAKWVGLETEQMQYWAYAYCSPLSGVIDRLAEGDVNGQIYFIKDNGTDDVSNSAIAKRLKKLFKKPNPLQTWFEFRAQQIVFKKTFGYAPVFVMTPAAHDVTESRFMWNLNPFYVRPKKSQNFSLYKNNPAIEAWVITINGETFELPSKNIFVLKDGYLDRNIDDLHLPMSKIAGLDWAISNILAAMEADNVLLRKKGPLGFISHDPKPDNVAGYVPMTAGEKNEIQSNLQNYGLTWSQWQYVISRLPVKWNPMSFTVKDLMTKETTKQAIEFICDRFNYPAELMSGKNATYENRSSAEKFVYQNNIIPSSIRDCVQYSNHFEMEENGILFMQDFSKLPVLQENIREKAEASEKRSNANLVKFQNCVITLNQWRIEEELDVVDGDDIYYPEFLKKYKLPAPTSDMKPVPKDKKEAA